MASSEPKTEIDGKAKRIWRSALDSIKQLDLSVKNKKAYRDVFLPDAITLRYRVQEAAEKLMFYEPLEFGRKCEEVLWRKVYYDIIQLMKHNRKHMRPNSSIESAFRTHLLAASGFYHHLLIRLQKEFNLDLDGVVDFAHLPDSKSRQRPQSRRAVVDPKAAVWARRACHRCLVYLGDIARYQQDYDNCQSCVLSQRYYHQALTLLPDLGMPHNQLGTLAGNRYYGVDAAYHYMRCMACLQSFEGAHGNLKRLFEKNRRRFADIVEVSPRDMPPDQQRSKDIRRFLVRYMHLLDVFYSKEFSATEQKDLQVWCQKTLADFNLVMFYTPTGPHPQAVRARPEMICLEDDIVLKIVVMSLMSIYNLQKSGNRMVTAAVAFTLALFSHVLNHTVTRLQGALYDLEHKPVSEEMDSALSQEDQSTTEVKKIGEDEEEEVDLGEDDLPDRETGSGQKDSSEDDKIDRRRQRVLKMQRRRRRRRHSGSSDSGDLSEGELHLSGDEQDELNLLRDSSSSDSDNDDHLMRSQELPPGFSEAEGGLECALSRLSGVISLHNSFSGSGAAASEPPMPDLSEVLDGDFNTDQFLESNFLQGTEQFAQWIQQNEFSEGSEVNPGHGAPLTEFGDMKDVVHGKKAVPVPPGFANDEEAQHVAEITSKLLNYHIDTDTDTSNLPTDTDASDRLTESELDTETDQESGDSVLDRSEWESRRLERLLEVATGERLLMTVKVFCDWMDSQPQIMTTCAQSSSSLWGRLSVLLNLLPHETDLANLDACGSLLRRRCLLLGTPEWGQLLPLPEDLHLHRCAPLRARHAQLNMASKTRITDQEQAALRVLCLRRYGYLASKVDVINMTYDEERRLFIGPRPVPATNGERAQDKMADSGVQQRNLVDAESRRNQLMRDMAQLRLQSEVRQLESAARRAGPPASLPPYLVPDAGALCAELDLVRELAGSQRFVVVIPVAVIDHLDAMKRDSAVARDASRFLESEFNKGSRYVRSQKAQERVEKMPLRNLKKKDKDSWRVLQCLDCAKYFSQQGKAMSQGMVGLLTNLQTDNSDVTPRIQTALAAAQQEGVLVSSVKEFHKLWQSLASSL